jgi:FKBP-type peptidyl-prolyl cis-trans isomerase
MFKRIISILTVVALVAASCGQQDGFKITESGLEYKFVSKGTSGNQPEEGQIITLNLSMISDGDSILMEASNMPIQKVEQMWNIKGGIEEAFAMLSEGDSIIVKVKAGDLYQRTWQMPVPPNINEEEMITCVIGLEKILNADEFQKQQALARVEEIDSFREQALSDKQEQMDIDIAAIDAYLKKNSIIAETTESGMRYIILEEGSGPKPQVGDQVQVNYTGNVLEGDYFDTSVEDKAKEFGLHDPRRPYGPFEFILGTGGVIHGWDEGIALLNQGTKARLYIPSPMAYGDQQRSEIIVANAILEFEVELVDITNN